MVSVTDPYGRIIGFRALYGNLFKIDCGIYTEFRGRLECRYKEIRQTSPVLLFVAFRS
jgi:hypothetical protein